MWPAFAAALLDETDIDVEYGNDGYLHFASAKRILSRRENSWRDGVRKFQAVRLVRTRSSGRNWKNFCRGSRLVLMFVNSASHVQSLR